MLRHLRVGSERIASVKDESYDRHHKSLFANTTSQSYNNPLDVPRESCAKVSGNWAFVNVWCKALLKEIPKASPQNRQSRPHAHIPGIAQYSRASHVQLVLFLWQKAHLPTSCFCFCQIPRTNHFLTSLCTIIVNPLFVTAITRKNSPPKVTKNLNQF